MLELLQIVGPSRQLVSGMGRNEPVAFKVGINWHVGLLSRGSKIFRRRHFRTLDSY